MAHSTVEPEKWEEGTWKTAKYACLNCGYEVDAASESPLEPEPRHPMPGDVTICLKCSHIMIFTSNMLGGLTVREPTADEMVEVANSDEVLMILGAMEKVRRYWKPKR